MTAYVFAELEVTDKAVYREQYVPLALQSVAAHGGRFISTGRLVSFRIGKGSGASRTVLIAFDNFAVANAFYDSAEYRAASAIRARCTTTFKYVIFGEDAETSAAGGRL